MRTHQSPNIRPKTAGTVFFANFAKGQVLLFYWSYFNRIHSKRPWHWREVLALLNFFLRINEKIASCNWFFWKKPALRAAKFFFLAHGTFRAFVWQHFVGKGLFDTNHTFETSLKTHFLFIRSEFLSKVSKSVVYRKPTLKFTSTNKYKVSLISEVSKSVVCR